MRHRIEEAADRLRAWIRELHPEHQSGHGEWESDYPLWAEIYTAAEGLLDSPVDSWSAPDLDALLFAIGRDNEAEHLSEAVALRPGTLVAVAHCAAQSEDREAKWQMAARLGEQHLLPREAETILLRFIDDPDEYVQRRALLALASIDSSQTEGVALRHWQLHEDNEHALMAALTALDQAHSSHLAHHLKLAVSDRRAYLSNHARRIQQSHLGPV